MFGKISVFNVKVTMQAVVAVNKPQSVVNKYKNYGFGTFYSPILLLQPHNLFFPLQKKPKNVLIKLLQKMSSIWIQLRPRVSVCV